MIQTIVGGLVLLIGLHLVLRQNSKTLEFETELWKLFKLKLKMTDPRPASGKRRGRRRH